MIQKSRGWKFNTLFRSGQWIILYTVYTKRRQFTENLYLYLHFTNINNETPPVQGVALTVYAPTRNQKETRKRRFIWNVSFHTGLSDVIVFNNLHNVLDFAEFLIHENNVSDERQAARTALIF